MNATAPSCQEPAFTRRGADGNVLACCVLEEPHNVSVQLREEGRGWFGELIVEVTLEPCLEGGSFGWQAACRLVWAGDENIPGREQQMPVHGGVKWAQGLGVVSYLLWLEFPV